MSSCGCGCLGVCGVIAQLARQSSYGGITSGTLQGCKFKSQ